MDTCLQDLETVLLALRLVHLVALDHPPVYLLAPDHLQIDQVALHQQGHLVNLQNNLAFNRLGNPHHNLLFNLRYNLHQSQHFNLQDNLQANRLYSLL